MNDDRVHVFGIRHHGPGCARSLEAALAKLSPDIVLVEGPPEAEELVPLVVHEEMKPPVAILVHPKDDPSRAAFYPFAVYSPEWRAMCHAVKNEVPFRFIDLPQAQRFALDPEEEEDRDASLRRDPLEELAAAAGMNDGEEWWDRLVESRRDGDATIFTSLAEAMGAVREGEEELPLMEARREATMRLAIRQAVREGHERIAVVCGAWHVPALTKKTKVADDRALLKGLKKVKTEAAWIPWTSERLASVSGYGAGVRSPEWYQQLWREESPVVPWLTRAARHLRRADLDASSASIIEAVRLAETLGALRGRSLPGLDELRDAALTVLCFGQESSLQLIERALVVGKRLGRVPSVGPRLPFQVDFERQRKKLRLEPSADRVVRALDLRKPMDLERSRFLHRLLVLDIDWGRSEGVGGARGTFRESWSLQWKPELELLVIEAGRHGNTVALAASARLITLAQVETELVELVRRLDHALLADLPDAANALMTAVERVGATGTDVASMMDALPELVRISRYGNVREVDQTFVARVVDGLIVRLTVGLGDACRSLDTDLSQAMMARLSAVDAAIRLHDDENGRAAWLEALAVLPSGEDVHGLLQGRACRLLRDAGVLDAEETATALSLALSIAAEPIDAASWIEGFLADSGTLLVHDEGLFSILDEWVVGLGDEVFVELLPLLRRSFSQLELGARRQLLNRVARGTAVRRDSRVAAFDETLAEGCLPLLRQLLRGETT
ncbi:MAG: DUF5682 family protein [Acidobacteriota bacterium]